jgi:hypothetical protein
VNFVAVADAVRIQPEIVAAALAADNLVVAVYFAFLFLISAPSTEAAGDEDISPVVAVSGDFSIAAPSSSDTDSICDDAIQGAKKCPISALFGVQQEREESNDQIAPIEGGKNVCPIDFSANSVSSETEDVEKFQKLVDISKIANPSTKTNNKRRKISSEVDLNSLSQALTVSFIICGFSNAISAVTSISPMILISAITVSAATLFPSYFQDITKSGGIIGVFFMQVYLLSNHNIKY